MFLSLKQKLHENYKTVILVCLIFSLFNIISLKKKNDQLITLIETQIDYLSDISSQLRETNKTLSSIDDNVWSIEWDVSLKN